MRMVSDTAAVPTPQPEISLASDVSKRPVCALISLASLCFTAPAAVWVVISLTMSGRAPVPAGGALSFAVAIVAYVVSLVTAILAMDREESPHWLAGTALGVHVFLVCVGVVLMASE